MNAVTAVDAHLAFVIFPDNTELDDSFGDLNVSLLLRTKGKYSDNVQDFLQFWFFLEESAVFECGDDFISSLRHIAISRKHKKISLATRKSGARGGTCSNSGSLGRTILCSDEGFLDRWRSKSVV